MPCCQSRAEHFDMQKSPLRNITDDKSRVKCSRRTARKILIFPRERSRSRHSCCTNNNKLETLMLNKHTKHFAVPHNHVSQSTERKKNGLKSQQRNKISRDVDLGFLLVFNQPTSDGAPIVDKSESGATICSTMASCFDSTRHGSKAKESRKSGPGQLG